MIDSIVERLTMDQLSGWRVADKLEKRSLLIGINCVAALSIFFFGYDQLVLEIAIQTGTWLLT